MALFSNQLAAGTCCTRDSLTALFSLATPLLGAAAQATAGSMGMVCDRCFR